MNRKTLIGSQRHPTETLADLTWRNRQAIAQTRRTGQHPAVALTSAPPATQITQPPAVRSVPPMPPPPVYATTRTTKPERKKGRRFLGSRPFWLMLLGVLLVIALWVGLLQAVFPAMGWMQDQWHYGDSRITQMDADVGHGGISHFIATYAKAQGEIVIIEIPLDHPTNDHIYTLSGFISTSGVPVILLSVADSNHAGKPDLLVQVEGTSFTTMLYNTGTAFTTRES